MLQSQSQHTSLSTSAHLAQTMTLLSLTSSELLQKIESELSNNPALEMIEERRCPMCGRLLPPSGPCPICSQPKNLETSEPIVFISPREDFYTSGGLQPEDLPEEPFTSESLDLPTYVLRQIAGDLDWDENLLAAFILNHLDDDGFLTTTPLEVARYHHRDPGEIADLINRLKRCEPIGVCAEGPVDAMLTQLDILEENAPIPPYTREVVRNFLPKLSQHHYAEIAHALCATTTQIAKVAEFIYENLNPFPARSHWGDVRNPTEEENQVFHQPDILIYPLSDNPSNPLVVEIILPMRGTLRVNPLFKETLKQINDDKAEEWREDLEKANLLIKCIQQRSNALKMLLEKLVAYQEPYIRGGDKELRSLTRAQIAKELDVHESTISRAVSGKTVQLPNRRIIPLSVFFDRSLPQRTLIREMIDAEEDPLSDSEIQQRLSEMGINIARRTVAKYRSIEGILPAHLRQPNRSARSA